MPSADACSTAGRMASESKGTIIRTSAPWEISDSISVSCFPAEPCASAEMYLSPFASTISLITASSRFQRSSWKTFQETPTILSLAKTGPDKVATTVAVAKAIRVFFITNIPQSKNLVIRTSFSEEPDGSGCTQFNTIHS